MCRLQHCLKSHSIDYFIFCIVFTIMAYVDNVVFSFRLLFCPYSIERSQSSDFPLTTQQLRDSQFHDSHPTCPISKGVNVPISSIADPPSPCPLLTLPLSPNKCKNCDGNTIPKVTKVWLNLCPKNGVHFLFVLDTGMIRNGW